MKHCSVEPMCPCVADRLRRADAFEELAIRARRWYTTNAASAEFAGIEDDLMNEIAALINAGMVLP